ncbi:MAG: membrane protein insertase YidC [Hyphococcus sp.]|nr:MAG: membrane protein insertase YidC [Marinicaulis sp.]
MDRNLVMAIVLSMGVLLAWDLLIMGPQREVMKEAQQTAAESAPEIKRDLTGIDALAVSDATISLEDALALAPGRVPIRTANLEGSINLQGGRIDDLKLLQYRETLDPDSPTIRLLTPREAEHGHYVEQGWIANDAPGDKAVWTLSEGTVLTPQTPIILTRTQNGIVFEKTISVDEQYMFTVEQTVRNDSGEEQSLTPYALVIQRDMPTEKNRGGMILHEGPLGVIGTKLQERKYNTLRKNKNKAVAESGVGGWVGITNKYWLAAAIPPQDETINATLNNIGDQTSPIFRAFYSLPTRKLSAGEALTLTSHIFGGVKDVDILQSYEASPEKGGLGVHDFDKAVDWGKLFFLTRPIFYTLDFFGDLIGNFGVAILILTLIVKALLFPIANKGYESMSKMKKLQPEIEKMKARFGDDKMKMQQEMMALYKKEKMNPLAGCLPILLQMPIFYALYKTLFVTIEMRHEPFILWIKDLSAPDPTSLFNLFGLLPYDPTAVPVIGAFLGIGVLPLLMGIGMWFQMKLNPPPADPMQAQIFAMMPFIFVFIFAPFAAGLVLYWFWNTALSILQQWFIMKRNGVTIDWGERFKFLAKDKTPAPGE